jgi:RHH-type proline utilization regulon transcriptional repressor/proline dehydrogenase/delta 1-pyrroline-5-carboxylate dehydrogenase
MALDGLEERIVGMGERMLAEIRRDRPSLFNRNRWIGEVLRWSMENEDFKVQLFRFIDVFPSLSGKDALSRHLREYFDQDEGRIPGIFRRGSRFAGFLGDYLLNQAIGRNIRSVARQFIVGEKVPEAVERLTRIRQQGFAFTVDLLGEAVVGEEEAEAVLNRYLDLVEALGQAAGAWRALGNPEGETAGLDWGLAPAINLSVKASALCSQLRPEDFEGSVQGVLVRLEKICERIVRNRGFLCIDMESSRFKNLTLEVYRRLRLRFPRYPHLGLALQSYLRETDQDLADLLQWARDSGAALSIRLVKGAYWEYEMAQARLRNWPVPVFTRKAETDAAFERQARLILENQDICRLACASHNLRSIMAVAETARSLGVPPERLEFQLLHGMAEPVARAVLKMTGRVRLYAPCGELIPGMAYLVRRLLENTSNESFLRHSFAEGADSAVLLRNPLELLKEEPAASTPRLAGTPFANEPVPDFALRKNRESLAAALAAVRSQLGRTYGFVVNGRESFSRNPLVSHNPSRPDEVVGRVCQAGISDVREALAAARAAFPSWRDRSAAERAGFMRRAAAAGRERFFELAAWQILEVGKQWEQACADVAEAIDFLEYYAREMERLGQGTELSLLYGESNRLVYEGKGVAGVIAPWNFPMAISCGMIAAALVTGNCVVYKPSERSPVCGRMVYELFVAAGLPSGVLHLAPGYGHVVGDFLVNHPDVAVLAFTGSVKAGLRIVEAAGKLQPGQQKIKKVIAEMGGKNAIIVDDDADLDEAVPAVVQSAFGFQGQKCSACSRLILMEPVHDRFIARLLAAVRSLKVGPAEDPACFMGPVIDERARATILDYIELGKKEGELLFCGPLQGEGYHVPMAIFGAILPQHRLAREEIFGPVLAVMKARDFDQALEYANDSPFALTGGLFSRSPSRIREAVRRFRVGNLYINRGITGALVGRQPFGGFKMSGLGTKAGGSDYLQNFMEAKVVSENTLRRGFAPETQTLR